HRPVTLLRWKFGPHPPKANAGVAADAMAAETRTTPISVAEAFFIIDLRCCTCVGHSIGVLGASVGSRLPVTFARYRESRRTKAVSPSRACKVPRQAMSAVSQRLA